MSTRIWASPPDGVPLCPLGFGTAEKRKSAPLCSKSLGKHRGRTQFTLSHLELGLILPCSRWHGPWVVNAEERPVRKGTPGLAGKRTTGCPLFPPRPGSTEGWPLQLKKDPVVSVSAWTFPWGGTSGREIRLEKLDADTGHRDTGTASLAQ